MTEINSTYSMLMPKIRLTPIKQKTKKEEVKEIIQNPDDPLAKYPLRAFGYSNEVGAAVSAMPGWGKTAEVALWVPALMYLGADIYDKFKRGKEGDYTNASSTAAVQQAVFQALASVILPTAAVKMGQSIAGQFAKADGSGLNASVKEELLQKLQNDFSKAKFAKGDRSEYGVLKKGKDAVWERIYDQSFLHELDDTKAKIQKESIFKKIWKVFIHGSGLDSTANADRKKVERYLKNKVDDIFAKQTIIETKSLEEIERTCKKKFVKVYKKAIKKAEVNYESLLKERPNFVVEKILSSSDKKYRHLINKIIQDFPAINDRKQLVSSTDKGKEVSAKLLQRLMKNSKDKELIIELAKKAEASNEIINNLIQSKKLKLGLLKTTGGFIALGLLAIPIDHFVHNYIIKKFVEPGLENVRQLQSKMSFKQNGENS